MDRSGLIITFGFIFFIVILLLIKWIKERKYNRLIKSEEFRSYTNKVNKFLIEVKLAKEDYFDFSKKEELLSRYNRTFKSSNTNPFILVEWEIFR